MTVPDDALTLSLGSSVMTIPVGSEFTLLGVSGNKLTFTAERPEGPVTLKVKLISVEPGDDSGDEDEEDEYDVALLDGKEGKAMPSSSSSTMCQISGSSARYGSRDVAEATKIAPSPSSSTMGQINGSSARYGSREAVPAAFAPLPDAASASTTSVSAVSSSSSDPSTHSTLFAGSSTAPSAHATPATASTGGDRHAEILAKAMQRALDCKFKESSDLGGTVYPIGYLARIHGDFKDQTAANDWGARTVRSLKGNTGLDFDSRFTKQYFSGAWACTIETFDEYLADKARAFKHRK
ncbi:hypothetical protein H9P43_006478 [Blastocladiella emersonii ATCC 22665]|nr:hypothetical protein H9P43_006478 [Blastocladiella emersonii ATCC 22665]